MANGGWPGWVQTVGTLATEYQTVAGQLTDRLPALASRAEMIAAEFSGVYEQGNQLITTGNADPLTMEHQALDAVRRAAQLQNAVTDALADC